MEKVSIAIPAYNEENCISHLLENLLTTNNHPLVSEIVVCSNGSTDKTEKIVDEFNEAKITKINSKKGKPNAWNILVSQTKNDQVIFFDADVLPEKNCVDALISTLPNYTIVGATINPTLGSKDISSKITRLLTREFFPTNYLAGGGYAINKSKLLERMHTYKYKKMPQLLSEDGWLQTLLKKEEYFKNPQAIIDYSPGSLTDFIKHDARMRMSYEELKNELGQRYEEWMDEFRAKTTIKGKQNKLKRFIDRTNDLETLKDKSLFILQTGLKKIIRKAYQEKIDSAYDEMKREYENYGGSYILSNSGRLENSKQF